jgi:hypothetical protein
MGRDFQSAPEPLHFQCRVVELNRNPSDRFEKPYGLELLHGLFVPDINDVTEVTRKLLDTLREFKRASWEQYDVLDFEGYRVPYIPLIKLRSGHN